MLLINLISINFNDDLSFLISNSENSYFKYLNILIPSFVSIIGFFVIIFNSNKKIKSTEINLLKKLDTEWLTIFIEKSSRLISEIQKTEPAHILRKRVESDEFKVLFNSLLILLDNTIPEQKRLRECLLKYKNKGAINSIKEWTEEITTHANTIVINKSK